MQIRLLYSNCRQKNISVQSKLKPRWLHIVKFRSVIGKLRSVMVSALDSQFYDPGSIPELGKNFLTFKCCSTGILMIINLKAEF